MRNVDIVSWNIFFGIKCISYTYLFIYVNLLFWYCKIIVFIYIFFVFFIFLCFVSMAIVFSPHVPTANFAEHKHNIKFYT